MLLSGRVFASQGEVICKVGVNNHLKLLWVLCQFGWFFQLAMFVFSVLFRAGPTWPTWILIGCGIWNLPIISQKKTRASWNTEISGSQMAAILFSLAFYKKDNKMCLFFLGVFVPLLLGKKTVTTFYPDRLAEFVEHVQWVVQVPEAFFLVCYLLTTTVTVT